MFHRILHLDESSDIEAEINQLKGEAERSNVADVEIEKIGSVIFSSITPLVESSKILKSQGSQISTVRTVRGPGYSIVVKFGSGQRPSLIKRIANLFRSS